jgi:hypothetical protein
VTVPATPEPAGPLAGLLDDSSVPAEPDEPDMLSSMSPSGYKIVEGEFGPEPVSLRDDDDSIASACCEDDPHDHDVTGDDQ